MSASPDDCARARLVFIGATIYCLDMNESRKSGTGLLRIPQKRPRLAVAAALALCAVAPVPCSAAPPSRGAAPAGAVAVLTVPVKGMTCALCTRGVEESVKRLDGVVEAAADLSTGLLRVRAADGRSLNIRDVKDRVQKAGFAVAGECEVEAQGRFSISPEGRITFRIPGTPYAFQVLEGSELLRLFRSHPGLKGDFFVAFRLHEHARWKPPAIAILRAEFRGTAPPAPAR
jgi:copper chaperone CopZ